MESMAVDRIMARPPVTVPMDASLEEAARRMLEARIGSVLVVDRKGRLRGIVTDDDFCARNVAIPFSTFRHPQVLGRWLGEEGIEPVFREARSRKVGEIMSSPVVTVQEDDTVEHALALMVKRGVKHVPVLRGDRPVGVIAHHDLLKLLLDVLSRERPGGAHAGGRTGRRDAADPAPEERRGRTRPMGRG